MKFSSLYQAIKHVLSTLPVRQDETYAHIQYVDYRKAIRLARQRIESGEYTIIAPRMI